MKYVRTNRGPVNKRPHYTVEEMEEICTTELQRTGLYPDVPAPIRIDRFIEKRFKISPTYDDTGPDILGYSTFGPNGVQAIIIAKQLDEAGAVSAERRLRTTLAHEAGHCLLHAYLFVEGFRPASLFGDDAPDEPKILCRDVTGLSQSSGRGYDGNWWEFQANKAIGGLLMPRSLVYEAIKPFLESQGLLGLSVLPDTNRPTAERSLAEIFDVNPVVARIRLTDLYSEKNQGQLTL